MGVYDHMARPSMGHQMQVELRDSMERYYSDKEYLQEHLAKLRLRTRELHTSPLPASPHLPIKKWGDPGSRFSQAPEEAAQKARLAQLEQENKQLTWQPDNTPKGNNSSILPPIQDHGPGLGNAKAETTQSQPEAQSPRTGTTSKPAAAKGTASTVQSKKMTTTKGRKMPKSAMKKPAQSKELPVLRLPIIYSATERRSVWDSGCHHLHLQGPSTHLEKNQVDEDCRIFRQSSMIIPPIKDGKRMEIQRPLGVQPTATTTSRIQFRRHPPHLPPPDKQSTAADPALARQRTVDHFPHHAQHLPELDDASTQGAQSDDGSQDGQEQDQQSSLPALAVTHTTKSTGQQHPAQLHVPPLRLQRGMTPSAQSNNTARSGATYMSLMSQETQEWKGAYMNSDDPHQKGRMLMEILHATRQRMYENEEDLRLSGDLPGPGDKWSVERNSDVMLVHRDSTTGSEATTARSSVPQQKPFKLPHHLKKQARGGRRSQQAKLHRYLNKLSHQRSKDGEEQRRPQHRHAPFQLATMTIREVTQSSIEHSSALQTAS